MLRLVQPVDENLLEAARRAFQRFGYQGATLERIAHEAGLSRVTLHRRGVTKQGLLDALSARAADQYRAAMWPALTGPGSAAERLERALAALCESAETNLALLVALRAHADAVFHEDTDGEVLTRSLFTDPLERLLRDGAVDGSLRQTEPLEAATVIFNLVGWTYVHLRTGHRWSPKRARTSTTRIALYGLVCGDAGGAS